MPTEISKVSEKDLPDILELILRDFSYTHLTLESLRTRFLRSDVFLFKAVEKNILMGFIDFEIKLPTASIIGLSVKTAFQKKGVATELAQFALDFLRALPIAEVQLIVKENNSAAIHLYQKLGFIQTQTLPRKIDNSVIVEMKLNLVQTAF